MYFKTDKIQITDNIENISANDLNINDNIFIIKDKGDIFSSQLILKDIKYNNLLYIFSEVDKNMKFNQLQYYASNLKHKDSYDALYMLNINNKLYYLSHNHISSFNMEEDTLKLINSFNFNNKIQYKIFKKDNNEKFISSLCVPIDKDLYIVFNLSNYSKDCVTFVNINNNIKEKQFVSLLSNKDSYSTNVTYIFNEFKSKLNINLQAIKKFEDICFLFNYTIPEFIQDDGKSVQKIKDILNKYKINPLYFLDKFEPVFDFKQKNLKVYVDKFLKLSNIYVVKDKEILNFGDQTFSEINRYYDYSDYIYINDTSHKIYNNKDLQIQYRIARSIGKFETYKDNIDPRTGELYRYGQKGKYEILYDDNEGAIYKIDNWERTFIKKYGFIIEANFDEGNEIRDRYKIAKKLG